MAPTVAERRLSAPSSRRGRVLVVDDELAVANTAKRILAASHEVLVIDDSRHALELLRSGERFDAVLCDLMMPQVTGMDLHAEVARLDQSQADRFVFITGGAFTPRAREFLDAVSNHRVEKPFDLQGLRAIVGGLIGVR
jgi:CheY-like chemotaxis protein